MTLISVEGCPLCNSAKNTINAVRKSFPADFREVVIDESHTWYQKYGDKVPVVLVNNTEIAFWRVSASQLLDSLAP